MSYPLHLIQPSHPLHQGLGPVSHIGRTDTAMPMSAPGGSRRQSLELFGFQLIAVFNDGFADRLSQGDQYVHLLAVVLSVVSISMVMAPASYHRQTSPMHASEHFVRVATQSCCCGACCRSASACAWTSTS